MSFDVRVVPATNDLTLTDQQVFTEQVQVTIPKAAVANKADIYFLSDTTGSMRTVLSAVQQGISGILSELKGLPADIQFGVGNYKDFVGAPHAFEHQQSLTANMDAVIAMINNWKAGGGEDTPEAQLFALDQLAEGPGGQIGWRSEAKRIVVWFGDAPGHNPICQAISDLSYDITEASVTKKLVDEHISVVAISTTTGVPAGLNANPVEGTNEKGKNYLWATSYREKCGAPSGSPGQADRIARATGGVCVTDIDPSAIVKTILNQAKAQVVSISQVQLVAAGATASFVTAISPQEGYGPLPTDEEHVLSFDVFFTGVQSSTTHAQISTGSLDVVVDGVVVGGKSVKITVPSVLEPTPIPLLKGPVYSWGDNSYSQLGDGTTAPRISPVEVQGLPPARIKAIVSGGWHGLALLEDSTVWAWGLNDWGQLGDGSDRKKNKSSSKPVQVLHPSQDKTPLSNVTAIASRGWPNVALLGDGTLRSWGANDYGQLGDGTKETPSRPVVVFDLDEVKAIGAGFWQLLAVRKDGTAWAWGANDYGQLGDNTIHGSIPTTRRKVGMLTRVKAVTGGGWHILALREDGTVWAWGHNGQGQLGDGTTVDKKAPVQVQNLPRIKAIAAGWRTSMALGEDGTVWTWGHNDYGQLGDGAKKEKQYSSKPVQVLHPSQNKTPLSGIKAIAAGGWHCLALREDGTVWAWGHNGQGQLGDGTKTDREVPVQVQDLSDIKVIAAGERYNLACR
ncbi:MAG TPA: VWA domain-containing protein [Ktedonobacteraceae bacterium]|nr:VWA domain-containing protein [Ktedonobacteraceae bacterium]